MTIAFHVAVGSTAALAMAFAASQTFAGADGNYEKSKAPPPTTVSTVALEPELASLVARLGSPQKSQDIPALENYAKRCRDEALAQGKALVAATCNQLFTGAAYFLGDAKGALDALAWLKAQSKTISAAGGHLDPDLDRILNAPSIKPLGKTVLPLSVTIDGSTELEYQRASDSKAEVRTKDHSGREIVHTAPLKPVVAITINGHPVNALMSTGTYSFALIMDKASAAAVGAIPLVDGLAAPEQLGSDSGSKPGNATLELVKDFRLGTLEAHNLLVLVVNTGSYAPFGFIVGTSLMTRYKQVTFRELEVTLDTEETSCPNPLPMTFAFVQNGGPAALAFAVSVADQPLTATFATGVDLPLIAGAKLLADSSTSATQSARDIQQADRQSLDLQIGKGNLVEDKVPVGIGGLPVDIEIGSPVLVGMDVRMRFGSSSICFLPRHLVH